MLVPMEQADDYVIARKLDWTVDRVRIERAIEDLGMRWYLQSQGIRTPTDPDRLVEVFRQHAEAEDGAE